jgi:hypothetical protein
LIEWKNIGYEVIGKTYEGRNKKAQKLEYHQIVAKELLEYP